MIRACPHHEYGQNHLNTFFYDGLNDHTKALLDSSVGGQLSKIPQNQVKIRIEEVVKNCSWGARGRGKQRGVHELNNVDAINAKLELLDKKLSKLNMGATSSSSNVSSMNAPSFSCDICGGTDHAASYCGGSNSEHVAAIGNFGGNNQGYGQQQQGQQGFRGNFNQRPQGFYHGNQQERWNNQGFQGGQASQEPYRPPPMKNQGQHGYNQGQRGGYVPYVKEQQPPQAPDIQSQILAQLQTLTQQNQTLQQQNQTLTQEIQEMKAHAKMVDNQLAQLANPPPPPLFPGNAQQNPASQPPSTQHQAKAIHLRSGTSYEGPKMPEEEAPNGNEVEKQEPPMDEVNEKGDEREGDEKKKASKKHELQKEPEKLYAPPVPFPYRRVEKQLDDKFRRFLKTMSSLQMNIPFLEAMAQMPKYAKFLKDLLTNKTKLEEEVINLPHQVSAIVQGKMPKKERDPGPFNLPVKLGDLEPKGALADLGASISLMPLSIAKKLLFDLRPSRKTIQLADRSVKVPYGEFEDIPIQVGHVVVPCDFIVMDMEEDPYTPLILGRAALKTLNALIDCKDDTITVEVAKEKVVFQFNKTKKKPMMEQICRMEVLESEIQGFQGKMGCCDALCKTLCGDFQDFSDEAEAMKAIHEEALVCEPMEDVHEDILKVEEVRIMRRAQRR